MNDDLIENELSSKSITVWQFRTRWSTEMGFSVIPIRNLKGNDDLIENELSSIIIFLSF